MAVEEALEGVRSGDGGPFGCVIIKDGEVVGRGHNRVLADIDPSAHGEIVAVRDACRRLRTIDLSGCVIYSSSEPCPMCEAAIRWARADRVVYAATVNDAEELGGFMDRDMYDGMRGGKDLVPSCFIRIEGRLEPFREYRRMGGPGY